MGLEVRQTDIFAAVRYLDSEAPWIPNNHHFRTIHIMMGTEENFLTRSFDIKA